MSELFTERELYEGQSPEVLKAHRAKLLGKLSLLEAQVFLINDVLGGMGVEDNPEKENLSWSGGWD